MSAGNLARFQPSPSRQSYRGRKNHVQTGTMVEGAVFSFRNILCWILSPGLHQVLRVVSPAPECR
jgi:hypothetical protein